MARMATFTGFTDTAQPGAGWEPAGGGRPLFVVTTPYDCAAASVGNGAMTVFLAADRATVDDVHTLAIGAGGNDEGAPALRPHYHADYYGCNFRDPDGNEIGVACHTPETRPADRGDLDRVDR